MTAKLTGIPGSHPSLAAELMLRYKGIPYERVDLITQLQRFVLPLAGYGSRTVPVLKLDGRKVSGSTAIARALDEVRPAPPLFPVDPERRARVEEVEHWADGELQNAARQLGRWAARRDPAGAASFAEGAHLRFPRPVVRVSVPPLARVIVRTFRVPDEEARRLLVGLPAQLDRVDAWIADGTLGAAEPTAADFQVATCVRLLVILDDLRPFVEERPAGKLARRLAPDYPGHLRPVFPHDWLEPLRATAK